MTYQASGPNLQYVYRVLREYQDFLHAQPNVMGSSVCMVGKRRLCIRLLLSKPTEGLPLEVGGVKVMSKVVMSKVMREMLAQGDEP